MLCGRYSLKLRPITGISRASGLSKSMAPPMLDRPIASLIAPRMVWNSICSSSNLISVLVGWMLTSMLPGSTSRKRKYDGVTPSGIRFS